MRAILGDVTFLLLLLGEAAMGVVWVVLLVPLSRLSGPYRRIVRYPFLLFWELSWFLVLGQLFDLVSVPLAWVIGLLGLLLAVMVATGVLFFRRLHDLDAPGPGLP